MNKIAEQSLKQLFTEAHTQQGWLAEPVSDETLKELYELMKWAPTSANMNPGRLLFVKSAAAKEKLLPCLSPGNVDKVKAAPVTVVIAQDEKFYEHAPKLFPQNPKFRDFMAGDAAKATETAFRNSTLQGAYMILAARSLGLDCGPMSGFDNAKVDQAFFAGTTWKSNFICSLGHGDKTKVFPRNPRLTFEEFCKIV